MVNALEFELDRPINVHRWRALEVFLKCVLFVVILP